MTNNTLGMKQLLIGLNMSNNYNWTILDIVEEKEVITSAKYHVIVKDELGELSVETEGNWYFNNKFNKPYLEITEQDVIDLIRKEAIKDGLNIIESRLEEQLEYLVGNIAKTPAPWLPQTFTPSI